MSLIKIASAIDRAFLRGELTQKGLKTIKNNGMLRSKETILNGFKEGTKNIALKKGYKIKQGKELNFLENIPIICKIFNINNFRIFFNTIVIYLIIEIVMHLLIVLKRIQQIFFITFDD